MKNNKIKTQLLLLGICCFSFLHAESSSQESKTGKKSHKESNMKKHLPALHVELSPEVIELKRKSWKEMRKEVNSFPKKNYQIYPVDGLGSLYVDAIPDVVKEHFKKGIYWESGIGSYVAKYTKENTIAIDAGACYGVHTITMSRKVGPKGKVIAFEPQRKMFCELHHNLKINYTRHNVTLLRYALGDKKKIVEMEKRDPINEGGTPIGKGGDIVQMITLDSLNLNNVSFIKMDVESSEYQVLKGARKTILRNKPVIVFEILGGIDLDNCPPDKQVIYDKIMDYLHSLDYKVERIFGNDYIATPLHS